MSLGVGIGDIVLVSGLAWRLYKACKESSEDFRRMSTELMSLDAVLRETADYLKEHEDLDISRRNRLVILCDGCRSTLRDLEDLVNRYDSLGTQAQRTWDRMRFGLKDLSDVRQRLVSTTTLLNAFNTTLINSSTTRIEKRLNKFLTEVQAGLREGSVVTTTDAVETIESPDVWSELRRELEDVGISATVVEENREYITSWMKTALAEGCMDERPPAPVVEPSDSGYGSGEGSIRRPSVISLNAANEEFEEEVYKQRCERPLDDIFDYMAVRQVQPPPTIRKRKGADPGRMLKKLFQKDTAIIQAASDGDINKVAKLISLGMDVNARDRWGWSALSMCGYGGYKAIARLLLDHGADLDNIDVDGDTPSSLAAQRGHTEVVILFDEEREARDLRLREMDEEVPRPVQI